MRYMLAAISALLLWAVHASAEPLALEGVTVIDPDTGSRRPHMTVVVNGTKIIRIGTGLVRDLPAGTRRVNATGKYLIPGLWDMHVHLFNNASNAGSNDSATYFPLLIANGVTGVRDMWTDADDRRTVSTWRREIDAGRMFGPRIVAGGRILDGSPVSWPNSLAVDDPAAATAVVRAEKAAGAQFIKVYDRLSHPVFVALAREAKRLKIPFAGHVPLSMKALDASALGQASIEHLTDVVETCSAEEMKLRRLPEGRERAMLSVSAFDGPACRAAARSFKQNGTVHTPTLVMHEGRLIRPFAQDVDARFQAISPDERQSWAAADLRMKRRDPKLLADVFATQLRTVAALSGGGAEILAGTDLGNPHVFAGSSLHDELSLMVRAGLSPQAALASATTKPVEFLGLQNDHGRIAVGKIADLVLLDADPLADIQNTKRISAVLSNGRYFGARELAEMKQLAAIAAQEAR